MIQKDRNHRYRSWEHCYNFFIDGNNNIQYDTEKASLHLAFYLASWGMYRGSSYLLQKDFYIHEDLIKKVILDDKYEPLKKWDFNSDDENKKNIELLFELNQDIKQYYRDKIQKVNGNDFVASVSDVLSTKIIMGTFGCVPAYDRFFIAGLKSHNKTFGFTFNKKSFNNLIKFYHDNEENIDYLSNELKVYNTQYPVMKILDMYFWQLGFEGTVN